MTERTLDGQTISVRFPGYAVAFALAALLSGCGDAGDAEGFPIDQGGGEETVDEQQAAAVTCRGSRYVYVDDGPSAVGVTLKFNCSDGIARVNGTLYDDACDKRSAVLFLDFYHDPPNPGWIYQSEYVQNSQGCNTRKSFGYTTTDNTPYVHVFVQAKNTWGWSTGAKDWLWP